MNKLEQPEKIATMPFTGERPEDLQNVLIHILDSPLSVELFDAFLSEYKKTGNLLESMFRAQCEWYC